MNKIAEELTLSGTLRQSSTHADADGDEGDNFEIVAIKAGMSKTRYLWTPEVLQQAVSLFNDVPVQALYDEDWQHGKSIESQLIFGGLTNARYEDGAIIAKLAIVDQESWAVAKLRNSIRQGIPNLFGFSIVATVMADHKKDKQGEYLHINQINEVMAVDMVARPAAGGHPIKATQSTQHPPNQDEGNIMDTETTTNDANQGAEQKAQSQSIAQYNVQPATDEHQTVSQRDLADMQKELDTLKNEQAAAAQRLDAQHKINQSALPEAAKQRLIAQAGTSGFDVDAAITTESEYIASLSQSSPVHGLGGGSVTVTQAEKMGEALDKIFDGTTGYGDLRSIKQAYTEMTGDIDVTGQSRHIRISQATTQDFPNVLGDAIHRRMLKHYNGLSQYEVWQSLVGTPIPLTDYKQRIGLTLGGFGDLPTVSQNTDYGELNGPGENAETYTPQKRGGTYPVTIEMVKNDDVGLISKIPGKMAVAAKRTLNAFVLSLLTDNRTMSDGHAVFSAEHNNLSTTALSEAALEAARIDMMAQKEGTSNADLGLLPAVMLVPPALGATAYNMFKRTTNNDPTFVQQMQMKVIEVAAWTDPTDWYLLADPMQHESIELGFMDGQQEPTLFVQDMPNGGSVFYRDAITYKIRHIYGGQVVDYRGLHKGAVV